MAEQRVCSDNCRTQAITLRTGLLVQWGYFDSYFADSISNGKTNMRCLCSLILLLFLFHYAYAGDDDSGPIQYSTDLSQRFTNYAMSKKDKAWSESPVKKFRYQGPVVHFVRTSLPLTVDDTVVHGAVYQAVETRLFLCREWRRDVIAEHQMGLQPRGRRLLHECAEVAELHRMPAPEWWRAIRFEFTCAQPQSDLARPRLE
jgi:hypothetical protein